jgi:hypothetical protein
MELAGLEPATSWVRSVGERPRPPLESAPQLHRGRSARVVPSASSTSLQPRASRSESPSQDEQERRWIPGCLARLARFFSSRGSGLLLRKRRQVLRTRGAQDLTMRLLTCASSDVSRSSADHLERQARKGRRPRPRSPRRVQKLDLPARRQIPRFHSRLRSLLHGADDAEKLRGSSS